MKFIIKSCLVFCLFSGSAAFANIAAPAPNTPIPDSDNMMRFRIAYAQVKQFYVSDKSDKDIFDNALHGMVERLDPHSLYLDQQALKDFEAQTEGNFVGIGIEVTMDKNLVKIVSPIDGTPAAKAGLKSGDIILAVNSDPLLDMSLTSIIKLLRGVPGSSVTLTVLNEKDKKTRNVTLKREKIHVNSVRAELIDKKYGYLRVSQFQVDTGKQAIAAVNLLEKQTNGHMAGLIIDLRNDPGGILDSAIELSNAFLDSAKLGANKKIVYTKGRFAQASMNFDATGGDLIHGVPIVVLINQGSASASEIVAGALKDHKRAVLVGQKTFGKGSVQTLLPLDNTSAIKLTTALYYTPNGTSIQAEGIAPDIVVDDLEVKKTDENALIFNQIREQTLNNHLKNAQKNSKPVITQSKDDKSLAIKDYQLSEALNVLKALLVINNMKAG